MNTLGVLAMTAALIATGASAQGVYDRGGVPPWDSAVRPHGSGALASAPAARRGGAFDGDWSVLIQTRVGGCEPSFRYGLRIENGDVLNAGGAPVSLEGHVARSGAVRVSVAAGDQAAYGAGRLSQRSGGGTWRGHGSRGTCTGTWVAERRQ
jgi:hypothetical protein